MAKKSTGKPGTRKKAGEVEDKEKDGTSAEDAEDQGSENGEVTDDEALDEAEPSGTELSVARSEAIVNGRDFKNALVPQDFKYTGEAQVGVVLEYKSGGGLPGQLVVTDIPLGKGAVYITAPIKIQGKSLVDLLQNKGVKFDTAPMKRLKKLLIETDAGLDAFYYGTDAAQPFILAVKLEFKGGLIDALVNGSEPPELDPEPDPDSADEAAKTKWKAQKDAYDRWLDADKKRVPVSQIFDLTAMSLRVVKVNTTAENGLAKTRLENYLDSLRRPVEDVS